MLAQSIKILCFVCHYYGKNTSFKSKSSIQTPEVRRRIVESCIDNLKQLGNIDIKICGVEGLSLFQPDINFAHLKGNPTQIVYESIYELFKYVDQYDYFICIEDDILLPKETFENVLRFDSVSYINEILLPNRLEKGGTGENFCVDLYAMKGWTFQRKTFEDQEIRVAVNPHSGLLIVSKAKLAYAIQNIDKNFRGLILPGPMASAFAHFHSPFSLYRPYSNLNYHYVIHLDNWLYSPATNTSGSNQPVLKVQKKKNYILQLKKLLVKYIIPPGLMVYKKKKPAQQ